MDHRRHILPSSFNPQQLPLDDPNGYSRVRQPLSDSAGNAQLHALASVGLYHDSKALQPRVDRPPYTIPTVPSQPARQPITTLELRRRYTRRHRHQRHSRNPILDSPQYQAYRARQVRDNASESEQKWPEVLEIAFLDALLDIPHMGRRKYSLRGKPHGRNELIKDYLWIAYCQSLPPGQQPDPTMKRGRKQVSSHIQVLKGFFRDHPAFERLFPTNKPPKNGLEDNFKSDPTLIALSQGRLPPRRQDQYMEINQMINASHVPMRPSVYWLLISSGSIPNDVHWRLKSEDDLFNDGVVVHKYTGLSSVRPRASLESIPNWRARWPCLAQLHTQGETGYDIIHMDVSLELMTEHAPDGAELLSRTEMIIPGGDFSGSQWRSVTSLVKPKELYGDNEEFPLPITHSPVDIAGVTNTETRIRLQFPANPWAHALTCMTNLQVQFEEMRKAQSYGDNSVRGPTKSAREYIDQISMYQELQSSADPDRLPYIRRAIIIWTFQKTRSGLHGETTWRYLDPAPPRNMCMSPSPHPSHHISASMTEHFSNCSGWDTPLQLQPPNMIDAFGPAGLVTPPQTAGLQSPFASNYLHPGSHYDLPSEHLSFVSDATADSESTLVNDTTAHIDSFLSNADAALGDYDHTTNSWHLPVTESFDTDANWASYTVPSTTPQLWGEDPSPKIESQNSWNNDNSQDAVINASKHHTPSWVDDASTNEKHDWGSTVTSPNRQNQAYNIDHGGNHDESQSGKGYRVEINNCSLPPMNAGTPTSTGDLHKSWGVNSDTFDYETHLANRLINHNK